MDPHGRKPLPHLLEDELAERFTIARRTGRWWWTAPSAVGFRPGGRVWPVLSLPEGNVLTDRLPVDAQHSGDLAVRVF